MLPFAYQITETVEPKKLEFPQESPARKRKGLGVWCHPDRELVYWKEISYCFDNLSDPLAGETRAEAVRMPGPHLGQDCLAVHPSQPSGSQPAFNTVPQVVVTPNHKIIFIATS